MAFIEWLSDLISSPIDGIIQWFNDLGMAIGDFFGTIINNILSNATIVVIEAITCVVLTYGIYCTFRIMFTTKDDQFSEYTNKTLISCICYYVAKYASVYALHMLGM